MSEGDAEKPHFLGHRQRLRERFLTAGAEALADYELLELLLFHARPRGDVKPLAKSLIQRFGSFAGVLSAPPARLAEVENVGEAAIVMLKSVQAAALLLQRQQVLDRPVLSSWEAVLNYCHSAMAHEREEQFRLLFLDGKNALIADEVQSRGTINHAPVYVREVARRALELGAAAIVMAHNHPTGDPAPSRADIEMTRQVKTAIERLGIRLHDHIIIGRTGHASLRSLGHLERGRS